MANKNEYIDEAYNTLVNLSADEQKRLEYEAREKAIRDYNAAISYAQKQGLKQGIEIGWHFRLILYIKLRSGDNASRF